MKNDLCHSKNAKYNQKLQHAQQVTCIHTYMYIHTVYIIINYIHKCTHNHNYIHTCTYCTHNTTWLQHSTGCHDNGKYRVSVVQWVWFAGSGLHHSVNEVLHGAQLPLLNQSKLVDKVDEVLEGRVQVCLQYSTCTHTHPSLFPSLYNGPAHIIAPPPSWTMDLSTNSHTQAWTMAPPPSWRMACSEHNYYLFLERNDVIKVGVVNVGVDPK